MPGKTKRKKPRTPVRVIARIVCVDDENYSVRLEIETAHGVRKTQDIPRQDFIRAHICMAELAKKGARIPAGMPPKDFHANLVQQEEDCEDFIFTTHVTGWHEGCYVMPDWSVGRMANGQPVEFAAQGSGAGSAGPAVSLKSWKAEVAKPTVSSSYLVLALCWALAPVLLRFTPDTENGILHFAGRSGTGKTTALRLAGSVSGDRGAVASWNVTPGGLEDLLRRSTDRLLVMDELKAAGLNRSGMAEFTERAAYIVTGQARRRSSAYQGGQQGEPMIYRLLALSAGEQSLASISEAAGQARLRGAETRFIDVAVPPPEEGGIFDHLGEGEIASELAKRLTGATTRNHGTALRAFVRRIADDLEEAERRTRELVRKFLRGAKVRDLGPDIRLGEKFGIAYAAGILATEFRVLPYDEATVRRAVLTCYRASLANAPTLADRMRELFGGLKALLSEALVVGEALADDALKADVLVVTRKGESRYYVVSDAFDRVIPSGRQVMLLGRLETLGIFVRPKGGPSQRSIQFAPASGGRRRSYVVFKDAVRDLAPDDFWPDDHDQ